MNRFFRSALFPLVVIVLLVFLASKTLMPTRHNETKLTYSELIQQAKDGNVSEVKFNPNRQSITATLDSGSKVKVNYPTPQSQIQFQNVLTANNVKFDSKGTGTSTWVSLLTGLLPILLLVGFWIFLMNQMQGGGSKVMSFGKSRAKRMSPDSPKVTYKDVAGADEAVEELHEIKEFLENPKKFQALGARIPKGVLLYGPPGTGKTLLARATAGEAGVPFFSISGSDFVEMFVGVGASRVRDLFEQAKQASPCIIFIDEIDAVGRHRGAGMGGGHDEREQTLNQLLVEMDGFEQKDNVILIAATNRPDILDPALLRPGRFDRQIVVDRPDRKGRRDILEVHSKGKPLGKELDLDVLAAQTPGFTGADLANVINESALLAARRGEKTIGQNELEEGIMRVIAGPEKKSRLFSEKERKITAYHETESRIRARSTDRRSGSRRFAACPRNPPGPGGSSADSPPGPRRQPRQQRVSQAEHVDDVHGRAGVEAEEPHRVPENDRLSLATILQHPRGLVGLRSLSQPRRQQQAREAVVVSPLVSDAGDGNVAGDVAKLPPAQDRRRGKRPRQGEHRRGACRHGDSRRRDARPPTVGSQPHCDHQRRGQHSTAHEVAADADDVTEVGQYAHCQRPFPPRPIVEAGNDASSDRNQRHRIDAQGFAEIHNPVRQHVGGRQPGPELRVGRVGEREPVVDERERFPRDERKQPGDRGRNAAPAIVYRRADEGGDDEDAEVETIQHQQRRTERQHAVRAAPRRLPQ